MTTKDIDEKFNSLIPTDFPNHLAIIPNGHRTWAIKHGKKPTEAHEVGMNRLVEFSKFLRGVGIHTLSVWAMSTENYKKRSETEVNGLMKLLVFALNKWAQELYDEGARIIHLGRKDRLPKELSKLLSSWEEKSKVNTSYCANIAFDYGGHDELLRAMKKAFEDIEEGKIKFDDLCSEVGSHHGKYPYYGFKDYLDTKDQPYPYPDLVVRTSGELRLSGFLPWQSVYSEMYTTPKLMPEMALEDLKLALIDYAGRKRTFGGDNNGGSKT